VLDEFDKIVGLHYVHCVHINDSKNPIGSHKDRHENFGYGTIGFDNLINVIYNNRLDGIPMILETPWIGDKAPYKEEIEMIRSKKFNNNLK
jgi:deoxyribonuclease-4